MATNNGYSGTLVPRIGYTRSVCFRNWVRRSFGQSGAVLGVFLYLIFAVPGNGYLTTGYTRSWLFPIVLYYSFVCFMVHSMSVSFSLRLFSSRPKDLFSSRPKDLLSSRPKDVLSSRPKDLWLLGPTERNSRWSLY